LYLATNTQVPVFAGFIAQLKVFVLVSVSV